MMCTHPDKNHEEINHIYTAIKRCLRTNWYLAQFYADKNYTKISCEYIRKKHWSTTPLSHACPMYTKISSEYSAKKH